MITIHYVMIFSVALLLKAIKNKMHRIALFAVASIIYAMILLIVHSPHFLEYVPLLRNLENLVFFILLGSIASIEIRKDSH